MTLFEFFNEFDGMHSVTFEFNKEGKPIYVVSEIHSSEPPKCPNFGAQEIKAVDGQIVFCKTIIRRKFSEVKRGGRNG